MLSVVAGRRVVRRLQNAELVRVLTRFHDAGLVALHMRHGRILVFLLGNSTSSFVFLLEVHLHSMEI